MNYYYPILTVIMRKMSMLKSNEQMANIKQQDYLHTSNEPKDTDR